MCVCIHICTGIRLVTKGNGKCHIILKCKGMLSRDTLAILIYGMGEKKTREASTNEKN